MLHANFLNSLLNYLLLTDICFLGDDIYQYNNVSQGKITIPGIDDAEESLLTDVSNPTPNITPSIPTRQNNNACCQLLTLYIKSSLITKIIRNPQTQIYVLLK